MVCGLLYFTFSYLLVQRLFLFLYAFPFHLSSLRAEITTDLQNGNPIAAAGAPDPD